MRTRTPFLCERDCNASEILRGHDCITVLATIQMKLRRWSHYTALMQLKQHGDGGNGDGCVGVQNYQVENSLLFWIWKRMGLKHNIQNHLPCNLSIHIYLIHNVSMSTLDWHNLIKMQNSWLNNNPNPAFSSGSQLVSFRFEYRLPVPKLTTTNMFHNVSVSSFDWNNLIKRENNWLNNNPREVMEPKQLL